MVDDFDPETRASAEEQDALKRRADESQARAVLNARKLAYYHMFVAGVVTDEDRKIVNDDLAKFCRTNESTFDMNERIHTLLTGRQEVMLRVRDYTSLSADDLFNKYAMAQGK